MQYRLGCSILMAALLAGCNSVPVRQVVHQQAIEITDSESVKPIAITKVVGKIKRGTDVGDIQAGLACIRSGDVNWRSGSKVNLSSEELVDVFREELESSGWPVVGSTEDLFNGYDVSGAEVLIAAKVKDLHANICYPMAGFGDWNQAKGAMRVTTEWQIYSPATRSLLGKMVTEGSSEITDMKAGASGDLLADSFAASVHNLLADNEFLSLVKRSDGATVSPAVVTAALIPNKENRYSSQKEAIALAKNATVTIRTATGHGSGFAIGDGNFILTNAHVVGEAKNVTILTQGKISLPAKVVQVSKSRDVALLSIEGIRLSPLYIVTAKVDETSEVYAVGSPLNEELRGSITRGIVSGYRLIDGQQWLQSDASISPGNSGGPLLNDRGQVVGISTAGYTAGGSQVGLNLFIPIDEALSYIGLKVQ
ncbi:MAG: trypsin-like serine protease [Oceanospirillales bacterium]|nr:trypsin-like serine protease [Oceanospirillales bacterium]